VIFEDSLQLLVIHLLFLVLDEFIEHENVLVHVLRIQNLYVHRQKGQKFAVSLPFEHAEG